MTMRTIHVWTVCTLVAVLAVSAAVFAGQAPNGWHSGVGTSAQTDPRAAGEEAAAQAKAKLGSVPAKMVIVGAAEPQVVPALVEGVRAHFDQSIIYGCQITSPLTAASNFPDVKTIDIPAGVCVLALGGDIEIDAQWFATDEDDDDSYFNAGLALGEKLKPAVEQSQKTGRVIITFGDQYNGANKDFAAGMNEGLEEIYPIVGAAAGNITSKVIVQGEIKTGINVGIFLGGPFTLGQSLNGGTHTPETAEKTLREAIAEGDGKEPFFALLFNCRRRRQGMIERNQLAEELEVIKQQLPGVDFFGFYGPGEIGSKASGEPAEGVGFTVVAAVFFAEE